MSFLIFVFISTTLLLRYVTGSEVLALSSSTVKHHVEDLLSLNSSARSFLTTAVESSPRTQESPRTPAEEQDSSSPWGPQESSWTPTPQCFAIEELADGGRSSFATKLFQAKDHPQNVEFLSPDAEWEIDDDHASGPSIEGRVNYTRKLVPRKFLSEDHLSPFVDDLRTVGFTVIAPNRSSGGSPSAPRLTKHMAQPVWQEGKTADLPRVDGQRFDYTDFGQLIEDPSDFLKSVGEVLLGTEESDSWEYLRPESEERKQFLERFFNGDVACLPAVPPHEGGLDQRAAMADMEGNIAPEIWRRRILSPSEEVPENKINFYHYKVLCPERDRHHRWGWFFREYSRAFGMFHLDSTEEEAMNAAAEVVRPIKIEAPVLAQDDEEGTNDFAVDSGLQRIEYRQLNLWRSFLPQKQLAVFAPRGIRDSSYGYRGMVSDGLGRHDCSGGNPMFLGTKVVAAGKRGDLVVTDFHRDYLGDGMEEDLFPTLAFYTAAGSLERSGAGEWDFVNPVARSGHPAVPHAGALLEDDVARIHLSELEEGTVVFEGTVPGVRVPVPGGFRTEAHGEATKAGSMAPVASAEIRIAVFDVFTTEEEAEEGSVVGLDDEED